MSGCETFGWAMVFVGSAALVVWLVFVIIAVVQVARAHLDPWVTVAWIVAIIAFPIAGTIVWYLRGGRGRELDRLIP